ncbi:putative ph domain-containing protein [Diplodia corticola]|uniref:Putative ph domain-containing protein n=1 Tax=Diplodia corticola TaxID=236234 RepID=A0A1J9SBZ5_9PEZI|nr:putative ph domain-containing protein [Diplodia corticola]OJD37356.1 putative ph domain-containing protein [Diplodia corticola]
MATFAAFLLVYVIGGLTFVPICLAAAVYLALLACPPHDAHADDRLRDAHPDNCPPELKARLAEPDVAAGYFAVCREYVPGGVNGKPPERTTPAGAVVGVESPSVYQSMYRTIFERNRAQGPSMEGAKNGKAQKKARNVFFVVLRHGHLILFDDAEQVEVRYVISLAHRILDVYAGGEAIPEGELWIKRNCIRLRRTPDAADSETESRPFYLFSENSSEKEDFYFALLRNQERQTGMPTSPPLHPDQPHVVKLVQQLHASEENLQTRWINALAGRVFLALYKTPNVEDFIRTKITKKISRVAKPAFIQSITIQRIAMGDSAPMVTNPKLRELTLDGDLTVEADIKYNGNFRLEIAAVARIDLGSRFKARYVNMVLAGILKRLEGHVLVRVKPPPSNRLWITFEYPPKMEMTIEPIVSSRQITYGMILRAIENRIREVVVETLVLPNWDDMPFFDTITQPLRGGIWEDATKAPVPFDAAREPPMDDASIDDGSTLHEEPTVSPFVRKDEKTMSMPNLGDSDVSSLKSRKTAKSVMLGSAASDAASASGVEVRASASMPRSMRSGSFASIARPVVAQDTAVVEAQKSPQKHQHDAIAAIKDISSRSLPTSPVESPVGSPAVPAGPLTEASIRGGLKQTSGHKTSDSGGDADHTSGQKAPDDGREVKPSIAHREGESSQEPRQRGPSFGNTEEDAASYTDLFGEFVHSHTEPILRPEPAAFSANSEQSSLYSQATDSTAQSELSAKGSLSSRKTSLSEKRQMLNMSLNSATTAAKKWFASRQQSNTPHSASTPSHPSPSLPASSASVSATGTPARSSSPTRDQPHQPSLWSQSLHSDTKPHQPQEHLQQDRVPSTPLSSVSSAKATTPSSVSPPKNPHPDNNNNRHPPSRSSSISVPMGRGQPLPPPGMPLPPPAKPENKWVQGSAQLLGLAKRKPVPPVSPGAAASSSSFVAAPQGNGSTNGNGGGDGGHGFDGAGLVETDIRVPAATAAPVGMHVGKEGGGGGVGGGADPAHPPPFGHARTTSSSSSLYGGGGGGNTPTPTATPLPAAVNGSREKERGAGSHAHPSSSPQQQRKQSSSSATSHHSVSAASDPSSTPPPPLPPRRKASATASPGRGGRANNAAGSRRRTRNHLHQHDGVGEEHPQLLVVAAPLVESDASSAPVTPEATKHEFGGELPKGKGVVVTEERGKGSDGGVRDEEKGEREGGEGEGGEDAADEDDENGLEGSVFDLELDDAGAGVRAVQSAAPSSHLPAPFVPSESAASKTETPASDPSRLPSQPSSPPDSTAASAAADTKTSPGKVNAKERAETEAKDRDKGNRGKTKGKGWFTSPSATGVDHLPEHRR